MPAMAPPERREHTRHPVRAIARVAQDNRCCSVEVVDMSFNGARLNLQETLFLDEGDEVTLTIELEDFDTPDVSDVLAYQSRKLVRLRGTLVHCQETDSGLSAGVEYRPLSEVDQVLLTLLLARPDR